MVEATTKSVDFFDTEGDLRLLAIRIFFAERLQEGRDLCVALAAREQVEDP